MLQVKCPKCYRSAECCYIGCAGSSSNQIADEYRLVCLHCGHTESRIESGGDPGCAELPAAEHPTDCPFCGTPYDRHQGLPAIERKRRVRERKAKLEENRPRCPKCDHQAKCYHYAYLVGERRFDYFVLHCADCGTSTQKTVGGHHYDASGFDPEDCPICGKPTNEHFTLPPTSFEERGKPPAK